MTDPTPHVRAVEEAGEWERHVTRRCPNQEDHSSFKQRPPGYTGPPIRKLAIPCSDCYSVESIWRAIPYEPDSRSPSPRPSGLSEEGLWAEAQEALTDYVQDCPVCDGDGCEACGDSGESSAINDPFIAFLVRLSSQPTPGAEPEQRNDG